MTWILLCSSSHDARHLNDWLPESVAISSPDGPAHLPTIWGEKNQKWHRGHITLQSGSPLVQKQSRDTLAAVMSIAGVDKLYETKGLENTMTPPRKPAKIPRRVVRVGLPALEKVDTWVQNNIMLATDETLVEEATKILRTAPQWLQRCGIHAKMDPVLGRCSWEEDSSISIRFRQTQRKKVLNVDRTTMRLDTCAMLNKLQKVCWPDNADFEIQDVECVSYITTAKRLEGMITVNYRPHSIMEQDILVGVLLAMHMGNDIPVGERGCAHKWCPVRNTLSHTACTVTKVSVRRTTRGHCRQDIPLGTYDRKSGRWTLKGNHKEVDKLMSLIRKGDDVSLAILEKMRAAPWKARPPNVRTVIDRCKERDDPWEDIPQEEDGTSEMSADTSQVDDHRAAPHAPTETQARRQRDLPAWQDLIDSSLEELTRTYPECYEGVGSNSQDQSYPGTTHTQEAFKILHTLTYDPEGRQTTNAYFDALHRSGYDTLATEGRKIVRNIVAGESESLALREWIHRINMTKTTRTSGRR